MTRVACCVLTVLVAFGCSDPSPVATDSGVDGGPDVFEVFAELGATSEGIAIGRTADGAPVMYVGTLDDRIVRVAPDGIVGDFVDIEGPLGMAVRDDGTLIVCAKDGAGVPGIFAIAPDGTISTLIASGPMGAPFMLTNFIAIAPDGSLVFTDSADDRLYRADADGTNVALVSDAITYPNGLAFSPDGTTLYVASWDTDTTYALSFDAGTYGAPTPYVTGVNTVDGIVTTSTGALVLVTSSRGILLADPPTDPEPLAPVRAITLPANGVFGDAAFGATNLYVSSLGETAVYVIRTDLTAP